MLLFSCVLLQFNIKVLSLGSVNTDSFYETGFLYVVQAGLELAILQTRLSSVEIIVCVITLSSLSFLSV